MDLYNREIIDYHLSHKLDYRLTLITLQKLKNLKKPCIFHSDQGGQYTSYILQKTLHQKGFIQSFSEKGQPYQNACMEAFFSNLKYETVYFEKRKSLTKQHLSNKIRVFIQNYNQERRLKYLNYLSPAEFKRLQPFSNPHENLFL